MIKNRLNYGLLFLLIAVATACGGSGQPKDASKVNTEPSSGAYPPQAAGDQNAADSLNVAPAQPADSVR